MVHYIFLSPNIHSHLQGFYWLIKRFSNYHLLKQTHICHILQKLWSVWIGSLWLEDVFLTDCTAVENAIKGDIPQHFERFKLTLRSSHGYNTRHGYLPRLPKPKTECGKRVSYFRFTNDWMSLPVFLRKPMPCTIFKKNIIRFLMDEHF